MEEKQKDRKNTSFIWQNVGICGIKQANCDIKHLNFSYGESVN